MKYRITKYSLLVLNVAIIVFSFLFVAWLRSGTKVIVARYYRSLFPFIIVWIGSGLWGMKYTIKTVRKGSDFLKRIFTCNLVAVVSILAIMYLFNKFYYSRYIVFGTIVLSTAIEIFIFLGVYFAFSFHKENAAFASIKLVTQSKEMEDLESPVFYKSK